VCVCVCVCVCILLLITLKNKLFLVSQILQATLKQKRFHTFLWNLPLAIVWHSNSSSSKVFGMHQEIPHYEMNFEKRFYENFRWSNKWSEVSRSFAQKEQQDWSTVSNRLIKKKDLVHNLFCTAKSLGEL
jgi:hypothetical protein